jgi:hypothetical protein
MSAVFGDQTLLLLCIAVFAQAVWDAEKDPKLSREAKKSLEQISEMVRAARCCSIQFVAPLCCLPGVILLVCQCCALL